MYLRVFLYNEMVKRFITIQLRMEIYYDYSRKETTSYAQNRSLL